MGTNHWVTVRRRVCGPRSPRRARGWESCVLKVSFIDEETRQEATVEEHLRTCRPFSMVTTQPSQDFWGVTRGGPDRWTYNSRSRGNASVTTCSKTSSSLGSSRHSLGQYKTNSSIPTAR